AVASEVRRTVAIRDGRNSTEVLRRSEVDEATGHETLVAREYAMLDRAGRLQLPAEYTQALGLRDRVALEPEPDHTAGPPDDRAGRLQLPAEYTQALGMRYRVALELEPDHIAVRPDDSDHG